MQIKKSNGAVVYIIPAILCAGTILSLATTGCQKSTSSQSGEMAKTTNNTDSVPTANNSTAKMTAADLQRIQNDPAQSPQQKAAAARQFAQQH